MKNRTERKKILTENNRELLVKVVSLLMISNNRIRKRNLFVAATVCCEEPERDGMHPSRMHVCVCVCEVWKRSRRRRREEGVAKRMWNGI